MNELQPQAAETTPLPVPAGSDGAAPVSAPADDSGSLADHEAAHGAIAPETDDTDESRNERGQFKPKRRAVSQRADADDVPVINELTRRLKTAEEAAGKDILRKEGESERVYTLRRRAEIAERLAAPRPEPKATPAPPQPAPRRQAQAIPQTFPAYEAFIAIPGNEDVDYDTYRDTREEWGYQRRRELERQQEAQQREEQTLHDRLSAHEKRSQSAATKYPDWETVVMPGRTPEQGGLPITLVMRDAIIASDKSDDITYFLGKNRDVLAALNAESEHYAPSAVAAMRRYLDTLVAPATSSPPSRPAAGSTGAALTLAPPPAPKPPTPVRTGAVTAADDPPDDDNQSLSAHEKHFGRRRA